ncbi:unnamed protein product [Rotaria sordida]|uniref:Uncharacterized protein n=1 Tax=Rotaria sordida TaxID=392033 RepID=A0A814VYH9_9BILA|nr:unnamed protein product [Rotaria sordida]CAF1391389.1 unnamed protein product [Rotaria sordida]CAF3777835.1 unnamed protein product [Rotaria sordida]CAF4031262.1 unnamed protein product [Rotaria sordida]
MSDTVMGGSCCPSSGGGNTLCCLCSCADTPGKQIGIRGAFGEEVFTFALSDVSSALVDIPAAAMPHKTAGQQY